MHVLLSATRGLNAGHVGHPAVGVLTVALRSARVSLVLRVSSVQWRHSGVDLVAGGVS